MSALAEFVDLRRLSRLTWTDDEQDQAEAMLSAASGSVRSYCGWHITAVTDETVTLDGPGGNILTLPCMAVTAVTLVKIVIGDSVETITDYIPSVSSGLLRRRRGWPTEFSSIEVTYSGGYDPAPAEVAAVVCSMVDRAASVPVGVTQEATGTVSRTYAADASAYSLTVAEKDVLGGYRLSRDT